ncbi:hypothetical protein EJ04DRAFT_119041 [Polyplosphaeria fusca]|uniref:Uncharacterized protein n=1 Tax=Polyplosphaeria fusca TaxID=682080 RepID=A0A9P4R2J6_9PLEO|nr:hypothetical protein EJ04DRAFT_119041 [Polyplosphaeria fusca]
MPHHVWNRGASSLPSSTVWFILLALLIAFPISILAFVLQMIASSILRAHTSDSMLLLPSDATHSSTNVLINGLPTNFVIGTSIATAIFAAFAALAFWELRTKYFGPKSERNARFWAWANIAVTLANLGLTVACTIVVFLVQKKDARKWLDLHVLGESDELERTRETWLCAIKNVDGMDEEWAKIGCGFAQAGRWVLIPLVVCSFLLVLLCFWQIHKRGGFRLLFGLQKEELPKQELAKKLGYLPQDQP